MKIVKPVYYKNFKCIAGDCPDSCCQGWEVDADDASLEFYKSLPDTLKIKQQINRVLSKDEFGNTIFSLAAKKRCPFLNSDNLCDMHIAIGVQHTPATCRNFPRFTYDFGSVREIGISFSCPVAASLIYNLSSHLSFEEEQNEELPSLNDIDALTFYKLKKARNKAFELLYDDSLHIKIRLKNLLIFAQSLQNEINPYEEGRGLLPFSDAFRNPELINPEWEERVNNFNIIPIKNEMFNEQIAAYFIYKYFLLSVYDLDVLSKVKMSVIGVLINTYFGESEWTMHLWSKETEHSQYNMDRYKKLLKGEKCFSVNELLKYLK